MHASTKNIPRLLATSFLAIFIFSASLTVLDAQGIQYTPLSPLPGTTVGTCDPSDPNYVKDPKCKVKPTDYIPKIFYLAIGIAGVLAVARIVIGGIEYLSTDAVFKKEEGKKTITNAIWGLVLAIGAFALLNTISSGTLQFDLSKIKAQRPPVAKPSAVTTGICIGTTSGSQVPCQCTNCVSLRRLGFRVKNNDQVERGLSDKLTNLDTDLQTLGIPYWITEAWPPTVPHLSDCHRNGTCVDINFVYISSPTAQQIKSVLRAALGNGFQGAYEVKTDADKQALVRAGVSAGYIWVTGAVPHFHIY
ncbi:hypothetical protein EPN83_03450 [Patescibacteria group bacterium]|nr:MAG: hypothetical protein EPN83_03450 [Patescibacteria group bacterium]